MHDEGCSAFRPSLSESEERISMLNLVNKMHTSNPQTYTSANSIEVSRIVVEAEPQADAQILQEVTGGTQLNMAIRHYQRRRSETESLRKFSTDYVISKMESETYVSFHWQHGCRSSSEFQFPSRCYHVRRMCFFFSYEIL